MGKNKSKILKDSSKEEQFFFGNFPIKGQNMEVKITNKGVKLLREKKADVQKKKFSLFI